MGYAFTSFSCNKNRCPWTASIIFPAVNHFHIFCVSFVLLKLGKKTEYAHEKPSHHFVEPIRNNTMPFSVLLARLVIACCLCVCFQRHSVRHHTAFFPSPDKTQRCTQHWWKCLLPSGRQHSDFVKQHQQVRAWSIGDAGLCPFHVF